MKTIYTTGVFDILHPGHVWILKKARSYGDKLIVGVQDDESVFLQKGKYPVMSIEERMAVLKALPFVDVCVSYSNIDQRAMLARLKPQVMVQINEWLKQADRSAIIEYLKQRRIRLVIVPVKKTISSTIIKKRVVEQVAVFRNDVACLQKKLAFKRLDDLLIYERFDPRRAARLARKIKTDKTFTHPITVAHHRGLCVVIDGVNRLEALKRLGANLALTQLVEYKNEDEVQLRGNVHFLCLNKQALFRLFAKHGIICKPAAAGQAMQSLTNGRACAVCTVGGEYYVLGNGGRRAAQTLNALVASYIKAVDVYRLSEFSQEASACPVQIIFKRFRNQDIVKLATRGEFLQSGITWHQIKQSIIRFGVPLRLLRNHSLAAANKWLQAEIQKKINLKDIRYHPSNVYVCDEWE